MKINIYVKCVVLNEVIQYEIFYMIVLPFANSNSPCTYRFIEFGHFMPMNMNILEIVMLVCDVVIC